MKDNETYKKHVGLCFSEALTILFVALKLCGVISWPWIWVLSPYWIELCITIIIAIIIIIIREHI